MWKPALGTSKFLDPWKSRTMHAAHRVSLQATPSLYTIPADRFTMSLRCAGPVRPWGRDMRQSEMRRPGLDGRCRHCHKYYSLRYKVGANPKNNCRSLRRESALCREGSWGAGRVFRKEVLSIVRVLVF